MKINNQNIGILVVDDEEIVVSLVKDALEDEGYNIITALDGITALRLLEDFNLNLLITDIRMSPMNGIELAQKVHQKFNDASIIFMTGYANLNSAKDAIKHGAVDYILKPFELSEIRQSVSKAVEKIKKDVQQKSSAGQIESLSDLNQLLYEVGDRKALLNISLKYALMQLDAHCGSVLFWDPDKTNFELFTIENNSNFEYELTDPIILEALKDFDFKAVKSPYIIDHSSSHSLEDFFDSQKVLSEVYPDKVTNCSAKVRNVVLPIRRPDNVYGIVIIAVESSGIISDSDLKLLSITSSQLVLSLENLALLEETQVAYAQLQKLHNNTIQLEKLATRGEISAEIGHELNNFLGVVAGNLSLLDFQIQKKNLDQVDKYLTAMKDNIEKIKKFTSNLMDLKPIASEKEIFYIDQLIKEVIDHLIPQKRFDGVNVQIKSISDNIPFEADSTHIQQLLYNLLNNAADATHESPDRKIVVSVDLNNSKNSFSIRIEDTGVGIEPELLEKAFKTKFTTKPTGHGFGLLVCKRIIANHHGELTITSTPGQGTNIIIEFPVANRQTVPV